MISYIRGELVLIENDKAIIDVNGIGFGIYMPSRCLNNLGPYGSEVKVYTYLNVREDAMQLFGFVNRDELNIFRLILGVSGIGPKGALCILSVLSPDDLRFAVVSGDVNAIAKAPGIGKKTAQKIILELNDKLKLEDALEHLSNDSTVETNSIDNNIRSEAIEALKALGFTATDSLKAINRITGSSEMNVEELIKAALKEIM